MKNVKNIIAIMTLVSVLSISNLYAADSTTSSPTGTWFGGVYNYIVSYFTAASGSNGNVQTRVDKLAANHNETLVRDEL